MLEVERWVGRSAKCLLQNHEDRGTTQRRKQAWWHTHVDRSYCLPSLVYVVNSRPVRHPVKKEKTITWGMTLKVVLWPSRAHKHTCMHNCTHQHNKMSCGLHMHMNIHTCALAHTLTCARTHTHTPLMLNKNLTKHKYVLGAQNQKGLKRLGKPFGCMWIENTGPLDRRRFKGF